MVAAFLLAVLITVSPVIGPMIMLRRAKVTLAGSIRRGVDYNMPCSVLASGPMIELTSRVVQRIGAELLVVSSRPEPVGPADTVYVWEIDD
jgi:hypothetical protein